MVKNLEINNTSFVHVREVCMLVNFEFEYYKYKF